MNKTTTAWGWLAAGVLALGVNGFLHDEGAGLAQQIADRVGYRSSAVLALASGRADEFLANARSLTGRDEAVACRVQAAVERFQARVTENDAMVARVNVMSARERVQLARLDAARDRMEAKLEAQRGRMAAQMVRVQFANVVVDPVKFQVAYPRVRVSVLQPMVRIPAPVVHVQTLGAGPI